MAHLYKRERSKYWWFKVVRDGKRFRESTRTEDKVEAERIMLKRVSEIEGIFGNPIEVMDAKLKKRYRTENIRKLPRVAVFDIETSPLEAYVWGKKIAGGYLGDHQIKKDWAMLCWTARWLFDGDWMGACVSPAEATARDDMSIMTPLWDFMEKADVIIAHGGSGFDIPRANMRLAVNGFKPTSPYQVIDTLSASRKVFGSSSFTQDFLNHKFGLSPKIHTDFNLWRRCVEPELDQKEALAEMMRYNVGDVYGLEELFIHVSPWLKTPVNLSMYTDNEKRECGNCLSTELKTLSQPYTTKAGQYESYRCLRCGTIGRSRYTEKTYRQRINSIIPTAR